MDKALESSGTLCPAAPDTSLSKVTIPGGGSERTNAHREHINYFSSFQQWPNQLGEKWLLVTHKNTFFPSSFLILGIEVDQGLGHAKHSVGTTERHLPKSLAPLISE